MPGSFRFFQLILIFCVLHVYPASMFAATGGPQTLRQVTSKIPISYENTTITEDVIWRDVIVVKGALVVAPQATLRIQPGTEIRFMTAKGNSELPRLVVMGRIECVGTPDLPILLAPASTPPVNNGRWGGVVLLSSEKRNQLEHCRFEGADTAFEARYSTVTLKSVEITACKTGILLHDSIVGVSLSNFSGCETGIEAHDSELEMRDTSVARNIRGMALIRSSVTMSSLIVTDNRQYGILAEDGRIKMTSSQVSGNSIGAYIKGVEGQLFMSRFMRNKETALHLAGARLKISRCQISDNVRDGLKLEDGRAAIWDNAFSGNGGYNLLNTGPENISALQNWWGAGDERSVKSKLFNGIHEGHSGVVNVFPWLLEKPEYLSTSDKQ